ncbi:hypothetical protein [Kribbella deserti]|uniref:Uncharacterized protein n=1 Tax=Kribbella deserti TaxID=1926257 RepID=A0ABV6QSL2_9ACTN
MTEPKMTAGSARLYRNNELLRQWPAVAYSATEVPPGEATYRLESQEEVKGAQLSTKLDSAWTFRSGHVGSVTGLPFMAVHFKPRLDARNRARAGVSVIPVSVQRQPGAPVGKVTGLNVDESIDDGKTWQRVKLARVGDKWLAHVTNRSGTAVSLRAVAKDAEGDKAEQRIIRAYRVN